MDGGVWGPVLAFVVVSGRRSTVDLDEAEALRSSESGGVQQPLAIKSGRGDSHGRYARAFGSERVAMGLGDLLDQTMVSEDSEKTGAA